MAYGLLNAAEPHFHAHLHRLLDGGAKRVCDVGGGARPIVPLELARQHGLAYVVFDADPEQLHKAAGYRVAAGSALDRGDVDALVDQHGPFDAVLSRWTAEHMSSGRSFHENVFRMLRPGGTALHIFPTLYALPFLANRLLSESHSRALLGLALPSRKHKWAAYYSWCRGPSERQLRRLEDVGYAIDRYIGFYGHNLYTRAPPLHRAEQAFAKLLARHPQAALTSFAVVVLRRPDTTRPTRSAALTTIVA